ncbi:MAG: alkaline phosphatase D family protein [Streptosporangiales bacterium]
MDDRRATVWVETDRPCEVEVLGTREPTWTVHEHHYALVVVEGLPVGSEIPYQVHLDRGQVWPEPGSPYPASVIRTFRDDETFRLAFGSCRRAAPFDADGLRQFGGDALVALAERMATASYEQWPDALFLAGDQIYADEPSEQMRARLRKLHRGSVDGLREEIRDFGEYTWLYEESWTVPAVRWLLSTVPTCMLLDDHDLRDDWNTSAAWRREVTAQPWWRARVTGALASYWVYQHLGNLGPDELAKDEMYRIVREVDDDAERTRRLDEFGWRADTEPGFARFAFSRDFGCDSLRVRMLAIDSRCARRLAPTREMVGVEEWRWIVDRALDPRPGDRIDHLLIGTTLPFLLPPAIHHVEGWNEALCAGAWGRAAARGSERVRQALDLEHWAAFRGSFAEVVRLLERIAAQPSAPASVVFLSGDVHNSYVRGAELRGAPETPSVHQLTMSPLRNPLGKALRLANRLAGTRVMSEVMHRLARKARVADVGLDSALRGGPWFGNGLMTVIMTGREARYQVEHVRLQGRRQVLRPTRTGVLT